MAKFNQLLDLKIKLDEASDMRRKASMQRAYLDQQIKAKAGQASAEKREKEIQHRRMMKLVDQVSRDKTDLKNRETLKKMQEKAAKINAVNNEKRRKEELDRLERFDREQILQRQVEADRKHHEDLEARRHEQASALRLMHMENRELEKQRIETQKRQDEEMNKKFLSEGIKMSEAQQKQRAIDLAAIKRKTRE